MDEATFKSRMDEAAKVAEDGDLRTAAGLYDKLGQDLNTKNDLRALDAFEAMARVIEGHSA